MVLAVETAAAAGDSDEDRITYATDDPEYREGGSDSGPSVLEELCCEVCNSPDKADILVLCDNCNKGTHTTCLDPPLAAVPQGAWLCHDCDKTTETPTNEQMAIIADAKGLTWTKRVADLSKWA
ncbi:PHD and RING finger domain-containing protein 1 [Trebouxia sp. C0009 RCD-2024]